MLTDCSPFRTGLADDASAELAEAHRRAFGLPPSVQEDLAAIASDRNITDEDIDRMFVLEMERRDRKRQTAPEPIFIPVIDSAGKKYKAFVRAGGKKIAAGTHKTYEAAENAAYDLAARLKGAPSTAA